MRFAVLSLLLATLPAFQPSPKKPNYRGPNCLSAFCINGGSKKNLAAAFGKLPKKETIYCYRAGDAKAYLQYQIEDEYKVHGKLFTIGAMVITDFPDCEGEYSRIVNRARPVRWKTREGIGLGSSEEAVVRAYGKPGERESVTTRSAVESMMLGDRGKAKDALANGAYTMLTYKGDADDLSLTWILLRDGKVAGILLSDTE